MRKVKNGKAVGRDDLHVLIALIEAWKCLGGDGVSDLLNRFRAGLRIYRMSREKVR